MTVEVFGLTASTIVFAVAAFLFSRWAREMRETNEKLNQIAKTHQEILQALLQERDRKTPPEPTLNDLSARRYP